MKLKTYELYGSHVGVLEQESEYGSWVRADDAQAEIGELQALLKKAVEELIRLRMAPELVGEMLAKL